MSVTNAIADASMELRAGVRGRIPSLINYLAIAFQFGLFLVLVDQYDLISTTFKHLGVLAWVGWSLHYFLPQKYRLAWFVLLSLAGIGVVFGFNSSGQWSADGLTQGAWLIALGLGLIALCNLPGPFAARIAVVAAVGGLLSLARAGVISVPWSTAIWPIFGSMFMFRVIVYLHQRRHEKQKPKLLETLGYFFMLPNVVFPLFPVVDFKTFRSTYYDSPDRVRIYQTGVQWMFRGAFHLLLYRLINQNFVIDAADVANRADLVQFMLWPFLLYLRVSGTFHIITGMMHLFGFNLPETHKLFFLSSSFTDFWRRINIYWKDFIMQVFYYPIYFKIRRWGDTKALVIATLLSFIATWVLHGYQWFWLRGTWLLTWKDGLFWAIFGALVVGNALYEVKYGRKRRLRGDALSWQMTLSTAMRALAVFATISILWSFWTAGSVGEWMLAWSAVTQPSDGGVTASLMLAGAVLAIGVPSMVQARGLQDAPFNFAKSAGLVVASAALALLIAQPIVHKLLGATVQNGVASMKSTELNRRDFERLERGYYEKLMDVGGFNLQLLNIYQDQPRDWVQITETDGTDRIDRLPLYVLRPSTEFRFKGATVETNQWGMRDQAYTLARPEKTLRIALLGTSYVMGSGVNNDETFEALLEERLNREAAGGKYTRIEILNFAVAGYTPTESLAVLEQRVFGFRSAVHSLLRACARSEPRGARPREGTAARRADDSNRRWPRNLGRARHFPQNAPLPVHARDCEQCEHWRIDKPRGDYQAAHAI